MIIGLTAAVIFSTAVSLVSLYWIVKLVREWKLGAAARLQNSKAVAMQLERNNSFSKGQRIAIKQGFKAASLLLKSAGKHHEVVVLKSALKNPKSVSAGDILMLIDSIAEVGYNPEEDTMLMLLAGLKYRDEVKLARMQGLTEQLTQQSTI